MKKLIAVLLICAWLNANAQNSETDSLKQLLQHEKIDTSRIILLGKLATVYLYSKPDTSMLLALQGLALAQKIKFDRGEAFCLRMISDAYDNLGNYPKSLDYCLQALKIYENIGYAAGIRGCMGALGSIYAEQGDYHKALEYSLKAKEMSGENKHALSTHLLNIGDDYNQLKLFDSGKIYNQQSYEVAMQIGDTDIIGCSLVNLGESHYGKNETALALEYFRLALPYLKQADDDDILCETYMQMAMLFKKTGQPDSSLYYAQATYSTAQNGGFTKHMYEASSFLTGYYEGNKNIDSAFAYQRIAMTTKDSLFSQEKVKQIQILTFQEKLRQQEIADEKQRAEEERKNNLQLIGITAFIITFILLFFLVIRRKTKPRIIEFFGIIALLLVFEFISLFIHPYIEEWTHHTPVYMLLILVAIASVLVPLHHRMESFLKEKMAHKIHHQIHHTIIPAEQVITKETTEIESSQDEPGKSD